MAGGRDGNEFGQPFDNSKDDDRDPIWHRVFRRQNSPDDKRKAHFALQAWRLTQRPEIFSPSPRGTSVERVRTFLTLKMLSRQLASVLLLTASFNASASGSSRPRLSYSARNAGVFRVFGYVPPVFGFFICFVSATIFSR